MVMRGGTLNLHRDLWRDNATRTSPTFPDRRLGTGERRVDRVDGLGDRHLPGQRRAVVLDAGRARAGFNVVLGKPSTPTPLGTFFVVEKLQLARESRLHPLRPCRDQL